MNPRQRRGALLIALAVVGAVAVLVSTWSYVAQVQTQVGPVVRVLQVREDVAAYQPLTEDAVVAVDMPRRWAPRGVITDPVEAVGLVASTQLPGGTLLQQGMLAPPPEVATGQRELAILVDAETGVAGKIGPGSLVDIYATFDGGDVEPPYASIVVAGARIIEVGVPVAGERANPDGSFSEGEVVPVTFALSIDDSLRVAHIESFAQSVRLALRAPTDLEQPPDDQRRYQPLPEGPSSGGVR